MIIVTRRYINLLKLDSMEKRNTSVYGSPFPPPSIIIRVVKDLSKTYFLWTEDGQTDPRPQINLIVEI